MGTLAQIRTVLCQVKLPSLQTRVYVKTELFFEKGVVGSMCDLACIWRHNLEFRACLAGRCLSG